ncbi:MAG: hypothetical protein AAF456_01765 [Planctomycetota bacterium]
MIRPRSRHMSACLIPFLCLLVTSNLYALQNPQGVGVAPTPPPPGPQMQYGELRPGDETLDSGEYVDSYDLYGNQGEVLTIEMRSDVFDPYLIFTFPNGEQEDNDDVNEGDTTAVISMTLPQTGNYRILATSYEPNMAGNYALKITRGARAPMPPNPPMPIDPWAGTEFRNETGQAVNVFTRAVQPGAQEQYNSTMNPGESYTAPQADGVDYVFRIAGSNQEASLEQRTFTGPQGEYTATVLVPPRNAPMPPNPPVPPQPVDPSGMMSITVKNNTGQDVIPFTLESPDGWRPIGRDSELNLSVNRNDYPMFRLADGRMLFPVPMVPAIGGGMQSASPQQIMEMKQRGEKPQSISLYCLACLNNSDRRVNVFRQTVGPQPGQPQFVETIEPGHPYLGMSVVSMNGSTAVFRFADDNSDAVIRQEMIENGVIVHEIVAASGQTPMPPVPVPPVPEPQPNPGVSRYINQTGGQVLVYGTPGGVPGTTTPEYVQTLEPNQTFEVGVRPGMPNYSFRSLATGQPIQPTTDAAGNYILN